MTKRIAAIYTTFKPDSSFRERVMQVATSCHSVIVVDNTPGGHNFGDSSGFLIIQDGRNKGLGPALNIGIKKARELGCDAVVLFDQDSTPGSDFLQALLSGLRNVGTQRCVVGPRLIDDSVLLCSGLPSIGPISAPREVSCLATSGMLFPIDELTALDLFSEDLFLDFVDFDWCWRMRLRGWRVFKLDNVPMAHRLGLGQRSLMGLSFHVPAPYRHYFQFRDTMRLLTFGHVPLYSKFRFAAVLPPKLLIYPFILDHGYERLGWMLKGVCDFFLRRHGVGSAASKLQVIQPTKLIHQPTEQADFEQIKSHDA